jgi:hypothetical protein
MNTLRLCFDRSGSGPVTARRVAANKLCELRGTRAGPYRFSCVFTEWACRYKVVCNGFTPDNI